MNIHPKDLVREISRQIPNAWVQVRDFRKGKGKNLPDWPDWCYIPMAAGYAISSQGGRTPENVMRDPLTPACITAAACWRVTQGIYRYDPTLYNALISQPLDDVLPWDILLRLPEWCVYIETPGYKFGDFKIEGFFCHLENDMKDGRTELRLLLYGCTPSIGIAIHKADTLKEGLDRMQEEAAKNAGIAPIKVDYSHYVSPLIQLVLYLCAENIDAPRVPEHPIKRVRSSGVVDAPKEPRIWGIGERVGSAILRYHNYQTSNGSKREEPSEGASREGQRPHIRRAHWHHFWSGPRDRERKLILRWLPPIPVNALGDEDFPVVIHPVK